MQGVRDLSSDYPTIAIWEWHLFERLEHFTDYMAKSAECEMLMIRTYNKINPEFVGNPAYRALEDPMFYVLCSGQEEAIREYYTFVDDLYDYREEPKYMACWYYRILVGLTIGRQKEKLSYFVEQMLHIVENKRGGKRMVPYARMLEAIIKRDEAGFHAALSEAARKYKSAIWKEPFVGAQFELLNLRAIPLCQLALMHGIKVEFDHPYVPKEILALLGR